jgi:FAD-dependent sensor of blue light
MAMIRTVYVSAATKRFDQQELRDLLSMARVYNASKALTGLLLYEKQSFFQILEGPTEEVDGLFARIERDPRHDRVLLLARQEIKDRNFGEWSMGFVDLDAVAVYVPGFVKLLKAKSSFLDLRGDTTLVAKLIDGFQEGRWRQNIKGD